MKRLLELEEQLKEAKELLQKSIEQFSLQDNGQWSLYKAITPELTAKLAAHQNAREAKEAHEQSSKRAATKEAHAKINEQAAASHGKAEVKPEKEGSFHGEAHVSTQERGTRLVPWKRENASGEKESGMKHVPNKVKVTHVWDHNKKQWNHKSTENVLPGLSAEGSNKHPSEAKPKHVVTPDDAAQAKMKAHESAKATPKVEVKPKTIVRKK